ncbi:MAG: selenoneine biosynthesis selenosugar synthase SenB [Chloroflexota bacterium]
MRLGIVTPAPPRTQFGNRVTALRWARQLRSLGHRVEVTLRYDRQAWDALLALHARRGHDAIVRFRNDYPERPIILALTGTDLYQDLAVSAEARQSMALADAIIVLQPESLRELPDQVTSRAHVVYQSVTLPRRAAAAAVDPARFAPRRHFDVMVVGHLRDVKDSMRTALAVRLLPRESRVRVLHCGSAMDETYADQARRELAENPRYRWLGEVPRWRVLLMLAQSQLFVHTSRLEGGANALGEALVAGAPVLASDIPGNRGLLSADYPSLFPYGDTQALAHLISRAERESDFLQDLRDRCIQQQPLFTAEQERKSLASVLEAAVDRARARCVA